MFDSFRVGRHELLVNPAYNGVTEDWFYVDFWGNCITPVSGGGRGSAWFIQSDQGDLVLRHYRRGGLVARVSEGHYLYTGAKKVRSVAEFKLLSRLHADELPVPRPVAACYWRLGLAYQAAIITERIQPARPLGAIWKTLPATTWGEVGRTIRRFHDSGVFHADLNCFNILIHRSLVYLIDFDKGKYLKNSETTKGWKQSNLYRLHVSLKRELENKHQRSLLNERWESLMLGYNTLS